MQSWILFLFNIMVFPKGTL